MTNPSGACAHLNVRYTTIDIGKGLLSGRWLCPDCNISFVPYIENETVLLSTLLCGDHAQVWFTERNLLKTVNCIVCAFLPTAAMTESRGAMTAQQLVLTLKVALMDMVETFEPLMAGDNGTKGHLRRGAAVELAQQGIAEARLFLKADALSAHNTAQLQKEVERTKGYDAVLAEVGKLQGIVEAGDAENVELQAALEAARNEKAMLLIELQKYHIAERLRSQGAGQWEAALRKILELKHALDADRCTNPSDHAACLDNFATEVEEIVAGLASPPEGQP